MPTPAKNTVMPGQQQITGFVQMMRRRIIYDHDSDDDKPLVDGSTTTKHSPVVVYDTDDNFTVILQAQPAQAEAAATASRVAVQPQRSYKKRVKHQSQQTVRSPTRNLNVVKFGNILI